MIPGGGPRVGGGCGCGCSALLPRGPRGGLRGRRGWAFPFSGAPLCSDRNPGTASRPASSTGFLVSALCRQGSVMRAVRTSCRCPCWFRPQALAVASRAFSLLTISRPGPDHISAVRPLLPSVACFPSTSSCLPARFVSLSDSRPRGCNYALLQPTLIK